MRLDHAFGNIQPPEYETCLLLDDFHTVNPFGISKPENSSRPLTHCPISRKSA